MDEAGFSGSRLADNGNKLAAPRRGELQRPLQFSELAFSPDEPRQPSRCRHLPTSARRGVPDDLE